MTKFDKAFEELQAMGAPVFRNADTEQAGNFKMSGEDNFNDAGIAWADYWQEFTREHVNEQGDIVNAFGVHQTVWDVLNKHRLFAEWDNPGCVTIWD